MEKHKVEECFQIFKLMAKAKHANHKYMVRTITNLFGCYFDGWTVVGITEDAYNSFKKVEFKRIPNKKDESPVERAHIVQRHKWVTELIERDWKNSQEWYDFIQENDKTVLATAYENKLSDKVGAPLKIKYHIPEIGKYFTGKFIGCTYRKNIEKKLLESFSV